MRKQVPVFKEAFNAAGYTCIFKRDLKEILADAIALQTAGLLL